jgi:hypothetical protein
MGLFLPARHRAIRAAHDGFVEREAPIAVLCLEALHQFRKTNPVIRAGPERSRKTVVGGDEPAHEGARVSRQTREALRLVPPALGQPAV